MFTTDNNGGGCLMTTLFIMVVVINQCSISVNAFPALCPTQWPPIRNPAECIDSVSGATCCPK
jgi:hypothetical protein